MMFSFKSKIVKNDVTLIKIICDYIFCGIGDTLYMYKRSNSKLLRKTKIFNGDNIQGLDFNPSKNYLLVHGGVYVKIFKSNFEKLIFEEHGFSHTTDWVLRAKWLDTGDSFIVVHMNNQITLYDKNVISKETILCQDKCILYSSYICNSTWESAVILSGTVFNEILIWKPSEHDQTKTSPVLARLKGHTGVIFSIDYHENLGYICSSSDDRSSVLWSIPSKKIEEELKESSINITQKCKVYGHESRVFRNQILEDHFITAGEDSILNIWDFDGTHLRTIQHNQGGCIWGLDSDGRQIVSGGGDGGVCIFYTNTNTTLKKFTLPDNEVPKSLKIVRNSNLAITTESGSLFYHLSSASDDGNNLKICHHEDLKTYSVLESSTCRDFISLSGYQGQIYIYRASETDLEILCEFKSPELGRIFSFHWLSCRNFITCGPNGSFSYWDLKDNQVELFKKFTLPKSRERWTTSACLIPNDKLIVGDRNGNIFVYNFKHPDPIQTFKKLHNHLGITKLYYSSNKVFSLGRNSNLVTFDFNEDNLLEVESSNKVPFKWLTDFSEKDGIISGFSGSNFIIFDLNRRRILLETPCGGGHRSWCFKRDDNLKFAYIKDKCITVIKSDWSSIKPIDLVTGFHLTEINAVKVLKLDESKFVLISGGEDTSLRISLIRDCEIFEDISTFKTHLSSIRTIDVSPISDNSYLIVSGGGRAQIVCWKLMLGLSDTPNISCSQEYSFYESVDSDDAETRIMDLKIVQSRVFAARSDGNISVFNIEIVNDRYQLVFLEKINYRLRCILKIHTLLIQGRLILISMATDGFLAFWDCTKINKDLKPFQLIQTHQSGINSHSFKFINNELMISLTGGDDNAVIAQLVKISGNDEPKFEVISKFCDFGTHCAQITGAYLGDNFFFTASIDQRVAFFSWKVENDELICEYLGRYDTSIADIQGIQCFNNLNDKLDLFLYGKGLEYLQCSR